MTQPMEDTAGFALPPGALARIDALAARYPTKASALMPCLWVIMDELGWVPPSAIDLLVAKLSVTHARVNEVLTFYTMFRETPQAKYTLQVCHNISCHIMGSTP